MSRRQVVVITGASAGVGRATAREFARRGASIGLIARGKDRLISAQREVEQLGGRGLVLEADVAFADQVEAAADQVEAKLGAIDVWINNAMVSLFSPVKEMLASEVERVTQVTYLGAVYGTMAALKRMLPRDHGTIVQVGSALAYRSIPLQSAYCAAKHALNGFTESLRSELLHDGSQVRSCMVQLPALNTPQFDWVKSRLPRQAQPVPPIFQPEVAARAIYWAAHQHRREVYVGGSTLKAIWGDKLFPGLLDRYLARMGYDAQQTGKPSSRREDNLWAPSSLMVAAHGRFDERAKGFSLQFWATSHRWGVLAATAVALAGLALRAYRGSS